MSAFRALRAPIGAVLALFLTLSTAALVQVGVAPAASAAASGIAVDTMTVNGRVDPLGIPGEAPSFGWSSTATGRDVVQSAYQVRVAGSEAGLDAADVWDSGKVASDRQVDVVYGGPDLEAGTRYHWQVRVWDGEDEASAWSAPAWFETGMLAAEDWGDAQWVGPGGGTEIDRWTDYTAEFDFTLDNLVFAALVRARDVNNAYMWQVKAVGDTVTFRPHRKVNGAYSLIEDKDITATISADDLREGSHTMTVEVDGPTITTSLDGAEIDSRDLSDFDRGFVGFRTSQATEGNEAFTVHGVEVTAADGTTLLDTDFSDGNPFGGGALGEDGLEVSGNQEFLWRSPDDNLPLLRTEFATEAGKTVERARAYATARGVYELDLNGEAVGDEHLAPGWTDYEDRFQHQTYDVTDLVVEGQNAFGAAMGRGWWAGKVGMWGPGVYGTDLSLLARIRIDYTDGTTQWVDTDDTWTSHAGPFVAADNIDGETYDARFEQPGWSTAGFDDGGSWSDVVVRESATDLVVPQPDEPVRTTEELDAVERTEPSDGAYVYDLGQNMVGVARMRLTGTAGTTVRIRYGEVLNPDGTLYTANLRAAKVTDHYTFAEDGTVTYEPTFTQHGFRYLEITGVQTAPTVEDVTGVVWGSDLPATGTLETSSPMLDQLVSNISWGQRGNFLSIPTDTPARDERLGWTGDINVFAPTASYLRDTRSFLSKWLTDLRDSAYENGNMPGVAPQPKGIDLGSGLGWSDAIITVPYAVWLAHDDASVVRENYAAMQKFLDFVVEGAGEDLIDTARGNWDDWLNLDDPTPTSVLGTAYYAENARMMSEMAAAIGEDADATAYAQLSEDVRAAFADELIADDGTVTGNSQTAYAMALGMGLVPQDRKEAVGGRFVAKLAASDNHLTTGFLGTPWLLPALSEIGRDDLAYTMLTHEDYPSWGYEVVNGATTMWERWNSIKPDGSFGDVGMNSFNHYAYGAVGDWMYRNVGGIAPLEAGYKSSRIAPVVGGGLDHAGGTLRSVYGDIATSWQAHQDDFDLQVEVPVNTTAQVVLPADNAWAVTEGGVLLDAADGVHDVEAADGEVTVTVGSGSYDFAVTAANEDLGAILDSIDATAADVTAKAESGDLRAEDADHLGAGLDAVRMDVVDAIGAVVAEDATSRTEYLQAALAGVQELRAWLGEADVDLPVRGQVDASLAGIESALARAVSDALGLVVGLAPVAEPAMAGSELTGSLDLVNDGDAAVTGVEASVQVAGWDPVTTSLGELSPGVAVQRPVSVRVPRAAAPGGYAAVLTLRFTVDGTEYTVVEETQDWATVTSGVEVGEPTMSLTAPDPADTAEIEVPLTNAGDRPVRVDVAATLPAGWRSAPSAEVEVPAGGEATAVVPVALPLDRIGGPAEATLVVRRAGTVLASRERTVELALATPPQAETVDHVDFGDGASEQAHALEASASSGTNTEAGYTRRYAHSSYPGSWYSVELEVPRDEPFLLRHIETYDGARTKKYDVYVDDVLVRTQVVPRAEGGAGIKVHDILVDDPALLSEDGTVRVRYEYPVDASGFYDPSLADVWVLPVAADAAAPQARATVVAGEQGQEGWYRSPVEVELSAVDGRDPEPALEYGLTDGWQPVEGPVQVGDEGEHTLSFRATDAEGNRSPAGTLPVRIDLTDPATTVAVVRGSGVAESDRAQLRFEATDALSGVAVTSYRVDGGDWTTASQEPVEVEGYGEHVVEYASTDLAGNAEPVQRALVTLADVEEIAAVVDPQVSGTPRYGEVLEADGGSWNTKGLELTYEWLRDGALIRGATRASYEIGRADIGKRISVRVTAVKAGREPAQATSSATPNVAKARSAMTAQARTLRGNRVRVAARVSSSVAVAGRVLIRVGARTLARTTIRHGRVTRVVRILGRGGRRVVVRYVGSPTVAGSATTLRVRLR